MFFTLSFPVSKRSSFLFQSFLHFTGLSGTTIDPRCLSLSFFFFCAESYDFSLLPTENNPNTTCHSGFSCWALGHISHSPHLPHRLLLSQTRLRCSPAQVPLVFAITPSLGDCCCFSSLLAEHSTLTSKVIHSLSLGLSNSPTLSTPLFFPQLLAKASLPHHSHQAHTHTHTFVWSIHGPCCLHNCSLCMQVMTCISISNPRDRWGQNPPSSPLAKARTCPHDHIVQRITFFFNFFLKAWINMESLAAVCSSHTCFLVPFPRAQVCQGQRLPLYSHHAGTVPSLHVIIHWI